MMAEEEVGWSSYALFVRALAGGCASVFAISVFFPLECARTRLQVDSGRKAAFSFQVILDVYRTEGIRGIYRGWSSLVLSLFLTNLVYFYVFHGLKTGALSLWQTLADLGSGLVAGVAAVLVSNPLWVVNTRLKLQGAHLTSPEYKELKRPLYSGVCDCLHQVACQEGVRGLWSGLTPSLILVINPTIQFMTYELLKRVCLTLTTSQVLHSYVYFVLGAVSKLVATVTTYPLQVYQTRHRAGLSLPPLWSIVRLRHGAWRSLYSGLESKLTQTVLTTALMYTCYEKITHSVTVLMTT